MDAGNALLLKSAWNDAFKDECRLFPNGTFEDQVTQASTHRAYPQNVGIRAVISYLSVEGNMLKQRKQGIDECGEPSCGVPDYQALKHLELCDFDEVYWSVEVDGRSTTRRETYDVRKKMGLTIGYNCRGILSRSKIESLSTSHEDFPKLVW